MLGDEWYQILVLLIKEQKNYTIEVKRGNYCSLNPILMSSRDFEKTIKLETQKISFILPNYHNVMFSK